MSLLTKAVNTVLPSLDVSCNPPSYINNVTKTAHSNCSSLIFAEVGKTLFIPICIYIYIEWLTFSAPNMSITLVSLISFVFANITSSWPPYSKTSALLLDFCFTLLFFFQCVPANFCTHLYCSCQISFIVNYIQIMYMFSGNHAIIHTLNSPICIYCAVIRECLYLQKMLFRQVIHSSIPTTFCAYCILHCVVQCSTNKYTITELHCHTLTLNVFD